MPPIRTAVQHRQLSICTRYVTEPLVAASKTSHSRTPGLMSRHSPQDAPTSALSECATVSDETDVTGGMTVVR